MLNRAGQAYNFGPKPSSLVVVASADMVISWSGNGGIHAGRSVVELLAVILRSKYGGLPEVRYAVESQVSCRTWA